MQDYNYIYAGCMEITLEIGCCKYPAESDLESYWTDNRPALMAYLLEVHTGNRLVIMANAQEAQCTGSSIGQQHTVEHWLVASVLIFATSRA